MAFAKAGLIHRTGCLTPRAFHTATIELMKTVFSCAALLPLLIAVAGGAEPTELREWHAQTGHTVEARALQVSGDRVQLQRADGKKVTVTMDTFTKEDQVALREHFGIPDPEAGPPPPPEGEAAGDLPHPLGQPTGEISCSDEFSYFLYLPESLRKGAKHPVVFVINPGGGSQGDINRYRPGAERNRWIIAVSKNAKNGFAGWFGAVDTMMTHVTETLPIDEDRIYTTGYSGGARMALATARQHDHIAGVIPCAAGGGAGNSKQVVYGLCGTNCFNRSDMARSFKGYKNKDCLLRYFPGNHDWAGDELCDDAITHLNGVFLIRNQSGYREEYAHYVHQVASLIAECRESNPMRAYMWTSFLVDRDVKAPDLADTHAALGEDEANKLYAKGLEEVGEFAQKHFGGGSSSEKTSAACKREAPKYAGTPWEEILNRMAEDAK